MSVPSAFPSHGKHLQNFFREPEYIGRPVFTGLVLRLSGYLLLNGGRWPEPQTRGETRLRGCNYFFLFSVLPLSRMHHSESGN